MFENGVVTDRKKRGGVVLENWMENYNTSERDFGVDFFSEFGKKKRQCSSQKSEHCLNYG